MFPVDAARWALSLEVLRVRKTGEKFTNADLRRVRKEVQNISGCTPAMARKMVAHVAVHETFNEAIKAPFIVPSITVEDVRAERKRARARARIKTDIAKMKKNFERSMKERRSKSKKKGSKKKVLKR